MARRHDEKTRFGEHEMDGPGYDLSTPSQSHSHLESGVPTLPRPTETRSQLSHVNKHLDLDDLQPRRF